jgi:hypothetical protein
MFFFQKGVLLSGFAPKYPWIFRVKILQEFFSFNCDGQIWSLYKRGRIHVGLVWQLSKISKKKLVFFYSQAQNMYSISKTLENHRM